MSIRTNQIKRNVTPLATGDQWLEENTHRKAEHMTGQLVDDSVVVAYRRSPSNLFDRDKPSNDATSKQRNASKKPAPTYTRQSSGQIQYRESVIQYHKDIANFEARLRNKEMIKLEDFGDRSRQTVVKMIRELRDRNLEVLTISTSNKTAMGWILEDTLEGLKHG